MTYDADGNMIERSGIGIYTFRYWFSAENRLDSLGLVMSKHVRYDYNALGKPVVKYTKDSSPWAVESYFIWDGDQLLLELDSLGHRKSDYTYFPGTIDQPAFQTLGATTVTSIRDFQIDALGNVIGTREGVHKNQVEEYDSWGYGNSFQGDWDNMLFKGALFYHDAVGAYYLRNRWYDAATGRFFNEDPIGHAGGENLYTFGDNDPVNAIDPSGLRRCVEGYYDSGDGCVMNPIIVTANGAGHAQWWSDMSGFSKNFGNRPGNPFAQGQEPNSSSWWISPDGSEKQYRQFGPDGRAVKDIDWGHDHGVGDPHVHDWDWNLTPARRPGRPVQPWELPLVERAFSWLSSVIPTPLFVIPTPIILPRVPGYKPPIA